MVLLIVSAKPKGNVYGIRRLVRKQESGLNLVQLQEIVVINASSVAQLDNNKKPRRLSSSSLVSNE